MRVGEGILFCPRTYRTISFRSLIKQGRQLATNNKEIYTAIIYYIIIN